jgi:hypothetical protein
MSDENGYDISVERLVGETLVAIDQDDKSSEILLTTASGRQFRIVHHDDCCESVHIEGTDGEWSSLIGKVIESASHEEESADGTLDEYGYSYESATKTTITFKVNDATVVSRWFGSSNGYYSESVNVDEITKSFAKGG